MSFRVRLTALLAFLLLYLSSQIFSQTRVPEDKVDLKPNKQNSLYVQPDKIKFRHLDKEQGLSDSFDWCVLKDKWGFMWIGTSDGLDRFDGRKIRSFRYSPDNVKSLGANIIRSLYEDRSGTLWVGTEGGGLNRYNSAAENFTRFVNNPKSAASISDNVVTAIYEDEAGTLWVGTRDGGLNLFNRESNQFKCFKNNPNESTSVSSNTITVIYEDSKGDFWIGTAGGGLNKFDRNRQKFTRYVHDINDPFSLSHNDVSGISEDNYGNLWISTLGGGLNKLIYKNNSHAIGFIHYKYNVNNPLSLNENDLSTMLIDEDNVMWIGSWGGGLNKTVLGPDNNSPLSFIAYKNNPIDQYSLSDNNISCIYKDDSGLLWVGTWGGGIHILNTQKKAFKHFTHEPNNPFSLSAKGVSAIYEDKQGMLWIGTWDGGLNKMDRSTNKFTHYKHNPNENNSLSDNAISSIFEDSWGTLWIGTWHGGLNQFDKRTGKFKSYKHNSSNPKSISDNRIVSICEDPSGVLWIGTYYGGLNKFIKEDESFIHFKRKANNLNGISGNLVSLIYKDRSGILWMSTEFGGLDAFDYSEGKFNHYDFNFDNSKNFSRNKIISLHEDKSGILWVGTQERGLIKYDRKSGQYKNYTMKDGLPGNYILGILEDDKGNLWITNNPGLSKFNPLTETIRNYDAEDGLQSNEFEEYPACYKSRTGELIFGGINGFNIFYPDSVKDNNHIPPIYITDFYLNNKSVSIGYDNLSNRTILSKSLEELADIELYHDDKVFSFDFVALDFQSPEKNKYAYILEGFDKSWIYPVDTRRSVTYTNLDPGEYIFRVKGSNNDGIWNEAGTSIKITILPPWWKTLWAYLFYTLFILSILYFTWKMQVKRIKVKHEYDLSRLETQKLHEIDEIKNSFFANISHEFRTPLTLILGPAKQLLQGSKDEKIKSAADLIHRSAKKLNRLVDELLDISKIESGEMKLNACSENLVSLVRDITLPFSPLADRKKINFRLNCEENEIIAYVDKDKFEKILNNVLSNAFKFTPEGGTVEVTITCQAELVSASPKQNKIPKQACLTARQVRDDKLVVISIRDTGIGIPKDQLDKIFNRFYQVDGSHTRDQEGTGIGLSLTKELIELHKGKIEVESEESKGSVFRLIFLLGKDHLRPEDICEESLSQTLSKGEVFSEEIIFTARLDSIVMSRQEETKTEKHDTDIIGEKEKPTLLVVDDNPDVRKYINTILEKYYQIIEAKDGEEGRDKSFEYIPNLIITDIMMPKLDGFQLCSKLKNDERTSHIPVIMLTAKATMHDKINGLEIGADDYIMKPFEADELKARIKNLLQQRERLHEHFRKHGLIDIEDKNITSVDKQFLQKAVSIINEHISDTLFGVEVLAEDMAVSRSLLLKKTEALIGESPNELIRRIRLENAANLLKHNSGNISEIALEVGFSNPSYFAEAFKKQFGVSPSQYQSKS